MSKSDDKIILTADGGALGYKVEDMRELESEVRNIFSAHITDIHTDETESGVELLAKIHAPDAHSYANKLTLENDIYQLHVRTVSNHVVDDRNADLLKDIGEWDEDDVGYVTQPHDMLRIKVTEVQEEMTTVSHDGHTTSIPKRHPMAVARKLREAIGQDDVEEEELEYVRVGREEWRSFRGVCGVCGDEKETLIRLSAGNVRVRALCDECAAGLADAVERYAEENVDELLGEVL